MTRIIDGHHVISDEPTPSPIRTNNGRRVLWRQTRTLTLDNGTTLYGCAHCDYISTNVLSIRPHLAIHRAQQPHNNYSSLRNVANALETALTQRNQWRERALRAERSLQHLRDTLQVDP